MVREMAAALMEDRVMAKEMEVALMEDRVMVDMGSRAQLKV